MSGALLGLRHLHRFVMLELDLGGRLLLGLELDARQQIALIVVDDHSDGGGTYPSDSPGNCNPVGSPTPNFLM